MTRRLCLATVLSAAMAAGLVATAHADVRVGPNYRMTSDSGPFRGKDMIALAVNPTNPNHVVATHANYLTENCEGTASFDGGKTWSEAAVLTPPGSQPLSSPYLPSCRISNHLGESSFQTVAFGTGQSVYATSITPRVAPFGEEGAAAIVYKSTDGGVSWNTGVASMPGGPSNPGPGPAPTPATGPYYELPTLAVQAGAGTAGADRIYSVAREVSGAGNSGPPCPSSPCPSVRVAVSNDGGQTWSAPIQASPPGVAIAGPDSASQPVISPDGAVTVAWRTRGTSGTIQIARSTNAGQSWGPPVNVTNVTNDGRSSASHVTPLPTTGSSFPRLGIDKANGNLYIVYNQGPGDPTAPPGGYQGADHFISPDSHVYFQRSLNNGASWSVPKLIGDAASKPGSQTIQTRHPSVSVAPNGRVDIVWEDRRHWFQGPGERNCIHTHLRCDDARLGDTYYAYSLDNGGTFSADRRVSDRSHNNDVGYDYRFGTGWAFGPQAVAMGNDKLLIGWMDSREGNFDDDTQDIYLSTVDFSATGPAPQTNIGDTADVDLAIALSKFAYPGGGESLMAANFATRSGTRPVIVNQDDPAAALAGAVLARANLAPVLLSPAGGLPAKVSAEVSRLAPAGAFVLGGTTKLSDQVVSDLAATGIAQNQITRVTGNNDADSVAKVAALYDRRTDAEKTAKAPAFDAAVIVNPAGPDGGAAAALAAARRLPILYVSSDAVPEETTAALSSLAINKTLVVGGTGQISDAVLGQLPSATRLGGANQYETSKAAVAEAATRGLPPNVAYIVDGTQKMDAALAGAAAGRTTAQLVLAPAPLFQGAAAAATGAGLTAVDRLVVLGPSPTTPPPPTPTATPTTPPDYPIGRKKPGLKAKVRPKRDRKKPFRFTTTGKLKLPGGVSKQSGCKGKVRITVTRKGKGKTLAVVALASAKVKRSCAFKKRVAVKGKRLGKRGTLRFAIRFGGNGALKPRQVVRTAKYGKPRGKRKK